MTVATPTARRRSLLVPGAAVATGLLGAATLILTRRHLGLETFAPLAQLWTIWAVLAAGLTFAFQQWAALDDVSWRSLLAPGRARRVSWLLLLGSLAVLVTTGLARDTLFRSSDLVWPIAAAALPVGTALNGLRRGRLARRGSVVGLAGVIAGENAVRLATALALVVLDADADWFALSLLSGFVVVLGPTGDPTSEPDADTDRGLVTVAAAAGAGFLSYAFMFGSPVLLAFAGGTAAEVSALFLVLTGVRVPFVVLQAVVPQLSARLAAADDTAGALAHLRRRLLVGGTLTVVAAALVGGALGDLVIGAVFSIGGVFSPSTYALLCAASVASACALIATVALVVERRPLRILASWGVPALSAIVVTATGVVAEPSWLAAWLLVSQATVALVAGVRAPRHAGTPGELPDRTP